MKHERDYIDTTLATVRQHRGVREGWPFWANALADEVEDLRRVEGATWVPSPIGDGVQCIICGTVCDAFLPGQVERTKRMHRSICPKAAA